MSDEVKAAQHQHWKRVAPGGKKHAARLTALAAPVAARMIETLALRPGARVLDVACGTGEPALSLAARVGPTGSVLGTDLVPEMLTIAREQARTKRLRNVEFYAQDGETLQLTPQS